MGITGLNPLNLLLAGDARRRSCCAGGCSAVRRRCVPRRCCGCTSCRSSIGGLIGVPHVDEIPAVLLRDRAAALHQRARLPARHAWSSRCSSPLAALLIGAAVARSREARALHRPDRGLDVADVALIQIGFIVDVRRQPRLRSPARPRARSSRELGLHANDLGRLYAVGLRAAAVHLGGDQATRGSSSLLFATMGVVSLAPAAHLLARRLRRLLRDQRAVPAVEVQRQRRSRWRSSRWRPRRGDGRRVPSTGASRWASTADANTVSAGRIDGIWLPLLPELANSPIWGNGLGSITWSDPMRDGPDADGDAPAQRLPGGAARHGHRRARRCCSPTSCTSGRASARWAATPT